MHLKIINLHPNFQCSKHSKLRRGAFHFHPTIPLVPHVLRLSVIWARDGSLQQQFWVQNLFLLAQQYECYMLLMQPQIQNLDLGKLIFLLFFLLPIFASSSLFFLRVSIGAPYVPLQSSLVQNFILIFQNDISIWRISIKF